MSKTLYEKLHIYSESDVYPFHMPGHKRLPEYSDNARQNNIKDGRGHNNLSAIFDGTSLINAYRTDITEIDGFDDLHDAKGILKEEQDRAAAVYGSKSCHYLVNGSTCGNLAAICASVNRGDKIIVANNCHRSVFHAIELMQLSPVYVYPVKTRSEIEGQITVRDIESRLNEDPGIRAVIITSPTYNGVVSDIKAIADAVHSFNIPLIVDEAHGAHLGFHPAFPENAVRLGADAVIMSLHKTLPSFTQTSLLHICSDRIDNEKVIHYLDVFETSSPSYVLMAGISRCISMLADPSIYERFEKYAEEIKRFREKTAGLSYIKIISAGDFNAEEAYAFDDGKIIISTSEVMSGDELKDILLNKYHLQMELARSSYVLAMTGIMDVREGFDRLADALFKIDKSVSPD